MKDAMVIAQRRESLAEKITLVARQYPEFGKAIDGFLKATPLAGLAGELVGIGMMIASNHGFAIPGMGKAV